MKRTLSILLALLLCAAIAVPGAVSVFAEEEANEPAPYCECDAVPVILLSGGHGALTENYGRPDEMWYYGIDMLDNLVRDFVPPLLDDVLPSLLTFNPSAFLDAFIEAIWAWIGPLEMRPDGTSVKQLERVSQGRAWTLSMDHRENFYWRPFGEAFYRFPFDWRQSPYAIADELNDFVQFIKAHTGHEHVHLSSISGSSSPLLAYVEKYVLGVETPDALSVVFSQPATFGMELVGNFLNADYSMSPRNAGSLDYFYSLELSPTINDAVLGLARGLYLLGLTNIGAVSTSLLPQAAFDRIYEEVTRKTYAAWPGVWAWCPPEDYGSARARLIDGHPEYEELGFLEKIDRYHALLLRAGDVLREAGEKIKVAVVTGYDMALLPLGMEKNYSSDGMVAVGKASLGAVAAPYGERLPAGYTQAVDDGHSHLSPDRKLDASPCALPEHTWFVRDMVHRGFYYLDGWYEWWLAVPAGEDTVFDNPKYPQFLRIEDKTQTDADIVLLPVEEEPVTPLETIGAFWQKILSVSFKLLYWCAGVVRWPLGWIWRIWV